jgi:hypothetical protein
VETLAYILASDGTPVRVDAEDLPMLLKYRWTIFKGPSGKYANVSGHRLTPSRPRMHRILTNAPAGMMVDHINHNGLDNRRSNLRLATNAQNQWNKLPMGSRSGFKGVTSSRGVYGAAICVLGKHIALGRFRLAEDAARAYDQAAVKYFGEFALINYPEDHGLIPPSEPRRGRNYSRPPSCLCGGCKKCRDRARWLRTRDRVLAERKIRRAAPREQYATHPAATQGAQVS